RAEYIRKGLRWPTILKNFTKLRERAPKAHIGIHCTYSIYNAYHITDFHRWVMEDLQFEPRQFAVNMLVEPAHLRADILPTEFREPLIERLEAYDRFIPRAGLNLMRSSLQAPIKALTRARGRELDAQTKLKDFYAFNDKVDRLRGEIFERIFPEFLGMRRLASGCDPSPEA
ncbi:MAG TPA: hypothetical protein PKC28_14890, partial [Bdellovibrionales bacterium]|nr:hypothetical protein [Bdellovibrionales bacterium]